MNVMNSTVPTNTCYHKLISWTLGMFSLSRKNRNCFRIRMKIHDTNINRNMEIATNRLGRTLQVKGHSIYEIASAILNHVWSAKRIWNILIVKNTSIWLIKCLVSQCWVCAFIHGWNSPDDYMQILLSAEEDNLSLFDSQIACLCQSIEINNNKHVYHQSHGAVSIRKTVLPGMAIPMLKIRRPNGRLIFNMEITIRR